MPDLSALLSSLKSPKIALVVFLFSATLLFAPFDHLGLTRPAFTTEYESFLVVILFLSAAILAVEILLTAWRVAMRSYYAIKRRQWVKEVFFTEPRRVVPSVGNDKVGYEDNQRIIQQSFDAFIAPKGLPTALVRSSILQPTSPCHAR
jgi:hypothetical protein